MRGKILFVVGLGVGYVLGTRAGRERYEQIKRAAAKVWEDPVVQRQVVHVEDFVKDKAPEVAGFIADGARKVVGQVTGRPAAAKSTSTTASKPAAKKSAARKPAARTAPAKPAASQSSPSE